MEITATITGKRWRWVGHVRRNEDNIARVALHWIPGGKRKRGHLHTTKSHTLEAEAQSQSETCCELELVQN